MRPVNLIPPEDRRGERAAARTGVLPYVILSVLGVVLAVVAGLALTNKQISDREQEKAVLEAQQAEAQSRADALAPYAQFAALAEARALTVTSLAQSRFDWVRVLHELSLVLPDGVWLTELDGSASAAAANTGSGLVQNLEVPSLTISGCATSHDEVATFVEALKDIDGVTRVGVESSEKGDTSQSGGGTEGGGDCRTRDFIAGFTVAVAFDSATVATAPATTTPEATTPAPAPPTSSTTSSETASDPQVSDAQAVEQQSRDSAAQQTERARNATNIIPGVAR